MEMIWKLEIWGFSGSGLKYNYLQEVTLHFQRVW